MTKITSGYTYFPMDFSYTQSHSHMNEKENVDNTSKETYQKSSKNPYDLDLTILSQQPYSPLQGTGADTPTCGGTVNCPGTEGGSYRCTDGCPTAGACPDGGSNRC